MFTKDDLHRQMHELGVPQNVPVLCHTSLRAVGETEGRGLGFLEALRSYITADGGILLLPTHTWAHLGQPGVTMDVRSSETCIGTLPSLAAAHPEAHRSLHPTHSMAAFGDPAACEAFIAGEERVNTATSPAGCHGRLADRGGFVLLIGVGHNRNTYLHSVEERLGVPNRLSPDEKPASIRLASGEILSRPLHCHQADGIGDVSARYPQYEPAFRLHGCIRDGFLGDAPTQLCDARGMAAVMRLIRERSGGAELFLDDEPIDPALYAL